MGGSGSGRWGSRRPIAEGLQRFDLAEYMRDPDAVKPNASSIANISNGRLSDVRCLAPFVWANPQSARVLATSRAHWMNDLVTGPSVRFRSVTIATGEV